MLQSFLALWLCHMFNDFTVQTESFINRKKAGGKSGYVAIGIHSAFFLAFAILLLTVLNRLEWQLVLGIIFIAGSHYSVDLLKIKIEKRSQFKKAKIEHRMQDNWAEWIKVGVKKATANKLTLFLGDQFLHFAFIIGVLQVIYLKSFTEYLAMLNNLVSIQALLPVLKAPEVKYLLTAVLMIYLTSFANTFIKILDLKQDAQVNHGAYIGVLERILIVLGVIAGQYQALAVVFAAKAAIRFNEAKDKRVAEYFIIGSFISAVFGLICGLILKLIYFW